MEATPKPGPARNNTEISAKEDKPGPKAPYVPPPHLTHKPFKKSALFDLKHKLERGLA